MKELNTYITGPKWSGIGQFITDLANQIGLSITIRSVDKGILRKTIYFKIAGTDEQMRQFKRLAQQFNKDYE